MERGDDLLVAIESPLVVLELVAHVQPRNQVLDYGPVGGASLMSLSFGVVIPNGVQTDLSEGQSATHTHVNRSILGPFGG